MPCRPARISDSGVSTLALAIKSKNGYRQVDIIASRNHPDVIANHGKL